MSRQPISEDRTLTTKYTELKLQGLFLHASPHYHVAGRIGAGTNYTNSSDIYTTQLTTLKGESFYIVRQTTNNNTARAPFTLSMDTSVGAASVVGSLEGRESKILVAEYGFGKSILRWTSAEVSHITISVGESPFGQIGCDLGDNRRDGPHHPICTESNNSSRPSYYFQNHLRFRRLGHFSQDRKRHSYHIWKTSCWPHKNIIREDSGVGV